MIRANIWRAATSAALFVAVAPLALAGPITKEVKEKVLGKMSHIITTYAYVPGVDFSKWPTMLEAHKEAIEKADTEDTFQDAVNEVLSEFKLTHLSMQTPVESEKRIQGESVGLGVNVQVLRKSAGDNVDGILVVRVVPGSAAQEAKLVPGDLITEADGKEVKNPGQLAGKAGDPVELTVLGTDGNSRKVKVVRRKFSTVRKEELEWLDKETAIIHVYTFDLSYDSDLVDELMKKASKAKNIIVDLRDNGGGVVANVQHFLGYFLPKETPIGTFINKQLVERYVRDQHGDATDLKGMAAWSDRKIKTSENDRSPFNGQVVVLVNRGTGSGAEIAAAAMRETLGSQVVGTRSAGAVLVALMGSLPEGYTFLYPITDYVTAKGVRLEGNGVEPDFVAQDPKVALPGTPDDVINKAVALIQHPETAKKADTKAG
jgi:carboxyl-terminal processing protease